MSAAAVANDPTVAASASDQGRLRAMIDAHSDFVWRALRGLGLLPHEADDATQRVFVVASERIDSIEMGCERAFLFQAALRVASDHRRASRRRRDSDCTSLIQEVEAPDPSPLSDELLEMRRARVQLDLILDTMPLEFRTVFILHELEQTAMSEIATIVGVPAGTVASRLRRARQIFRAGIERLVEGVSLGGQEP